MRKFMYLASAVAVILAATMIARTVHPATGMPQAQAGVIDIRQLQSTIDVGRLPRLDVAEPY